MKKATKICLIICLVLTVFGVLLCMMGAVMGFGFGQYRNMVKYGIFPIGDKKKLWLMEGTGAQKIENGDWSQTTGVWEASKVKNLEVQFSFGNLRIEPSDSQEIEISADYRNKWDNYTRTLDFRLEGDTLRLEDRMDKKISRLFHVGNEDATLVIRIPKDYEFEKAEFEMGAGVLSVETRLMAEELTIRLGAGEMGKSEGLSKLIANTITLEAGAGEIKWSGIQTDELEISVGTGEMELTDVTVRDMDVECGIGSMKVVVAGSQQDYNYEIECGIGDVTVGTASFAGIGKEKHIDNHAERDINIECGVGEVEISFSENEP